MKRSHLSDERGGVIIITALILISLVGMMVLAIDGGGLLSTRRHMVTAADSAALAAALACAVPGGDPAGRADSVAVANVSYANRTDGPTVTPSGACGTKASGEVSVEYTGSHELTFAPVLGFPKDIDVRAQATALWGPAGGANSVPLQLQQFQLDQCDPEHQPVGTECDFWLNNNDLGNAQWAWMNLAQWNVAPTAHCSSAGTSERRHWIQDGYPDPLILNYPDPTYVCSDTGASNADYSALAGEKGKIKSFPVNDETKQIDSGGNLCPPPCAPDKYDVIGFIPLRIEDVLRGDDPIAIGTPGGSGDCSKNHGFRTFDVVDLDNLNGGGCPGGVSVDTLTPNGPGTPPSLLSKGNTMFQEGTDYTYDPVTHVVTWLRNDTNGVDIRFHWVKDPTPGKCGIHAPDPNAHCLVTTWQGPQEGGHDPCPECPDFGLRAVRLSE